MSKGLKKITTAQELARDEAIASMNEDLHKEYLEILEEIGDLSSNAVMAYHRLGTRMMKVHQNYKKYGEGAIQKLASAITVSPSIVYQSKDLAEQHTWAQLQEILQRGRKNRHIVTMGHLVPLLSIHDKEQRDILIDRIVEDGLTVAALRTLISKQHLIRDLSNINQVPKSLVGGLRQIAGMSDRLVQKFDTDLRELVFDPLFSLSETAMDDKLLEQAQKSYDALSALADRADRRAEDLRQALLDIEAANKKKKSHKADEKVANQDPGEAESDEPEAPKRRRRPSS